MTGGNGHTAADPASPGASGPRAILVAYAVLQAVSAALLVVGGTVLHVLLPWVLPRAGEFGQSWLAAFVLVPVCFVPALVWWQGWANRRFGRRPRSWRLVAEVSFAVDVIGFLLVQGLA
jgi:hypothetical protein